MRFLLNETSHLTPFARNRYSELVACEPFFVAHTCSRECISENGFRRRTIGLICSYFSKPGCLRAAPTLNELSRSKEQLLLMQDRHGYSARFTRRCQVSRHR